MIVIKQRNSILAFEDKELTFVTQRYSFNAQGGPTQAQIDVYGSELDLWKLLERLGCELWVVSAQGDATWWGYIHRVQLEIGKLAVGVSLDAMYNRVAVAYSYVAEGNDQVGERRTTDWAQDDASIAAYGQKELLLSSSGSTPAHAEAGRDTTLAQARYPQPSVDVGETARTNRATLTCRGWWDTMGWRYYANSGTSLVDTATQVAAIVTATNGFIKAVDIDDLSGLSVSEYRDGDSTALHEIEELLKLGDVNKKRMLATVDINRRMRIAAEPASSQPHLLNRAGDIFDAHHNPVRKETCPVGEWVRLLDVIPGSVDGTLLATPELLFIEESEYFPAENRLAIRPKGAPTSWNIGDIRDG